MEDNHYKPIFEVLPFEYNPYSEVFEDEWQNELQPGSRAYNRWVQESLNKILGLRLAVDGDLGTQSRSAIRSFQQKYGLAVDGVVGSQTDAALRGALAKPGIPQTQPPPSQPPAQPASTTSGVEAADNTTRIIPCIQELRDKDRSISFVVRYTWQLRRPEAVALSNAGLRIVSCYEQWNSAGFGPTKMEYFTRAQGQQDGRRGFNQVHAVGQTANTPLYFAVDTDPNVRQRQIILDYFQGVQEGYNQYLADMRAQNKPAVTYAIGVYGSGCILDWCQAQGIATWFWQAFAPGWCNNRSVWPAANIHTSGRDEPRRCGWRLGRLEGWGNEGGW